MLLNPGESKLKSSRFIPMNPGYKVIKRFSCSTQLSMEFFLFNIIEQEK